MRTRLGISTISYNTEEFLKMVLDDLFKRKIISKYFYIYHFGENDEAGSKKHAHVYMMPNGQIDTCDLRQKFRQQSPDGNPKPLGCMDFWSSKSLDDWVLYTEHDPAYLAFKFQSREYIYNKEDFVVSDEYDFENAYYHAHYASDYANKSHLLKMLNDCSVNPADLIANGSVPLQMASQLNAFNYMKNHYGCLDRNGRASHWVQAKQEFYSSDNDITIDNLDNCDIVEVADKSDITTTIYRLN